MRIENIRLDSERMDSITLLENGFLKVPAFLTRAGVFNYSDRNGIIRRELRPVNEVFNQESMNTLALKSITFEHPAELVNSENYKKYDIGTIGENITQSGNLIQANLMIKDKNIIDYILMKKDAGQNVELSCGYTCELINQNGIDPEEGAFDAIQTNIKYNHLSIVDKGRAGAEVKLKLDSQDISEVKMEEIKFDAMPEYIELKQKFDAAETEKEELKVKLDSALIENENSKKEIEELKVKVDSLNSIDSEIVQAFVKDAMDINTACQMAGIDPNGKNMKALRIEIIKKANSEFNEDNKSEVYLNAYYDAAKIIIKDRKDKEDAEKISSARKDSGNKINAREQYIKSRQFNN